MTIQRYRDVERAMQEFVSLAFYPQPFFQELGQGLWSSEFLKYFAVQYGYYSAHFPRILGAAIAAMEPDDAWWIPLADNLWDEAGRGVPGQSHQQLYRTFLVSVAPEWGDPNARPPLGDAVRRTVQGSLALLRVVTPWEAMAAIGLGSEFFAADVMGTIAQGLKHPHYQGDRPVDTRFWDLHAAKDEPRHYALCRAQLQRLEDPAHLTQALAVGQRFAQLEALMYHGIYDEFHSRVAQFTG
ncbi:hypothetical protein TPY_3063 [Sulfobacillus acidophilus TPY]|uniref:Uncharacterized protein n=1 Tax=Sulfobacillus acidophilus (strain ATCC 700253 / DSM 10332 / NAL) TaxID=679936 RepID=G8TS07_SULAD|nr:hypothetical protein TPY_3063 [Sulfobacillus acidophilus TPY]AEW04333.1 hypothetical protein Sulac_0830 [Sulfobacillus acidophilus DSM 10332]